DDQAVRAGGERARLRLEDALLTGRVGVEGGGGGGVADEGDRHAGEARVDREVHLDLIALVDVAGQVGDGGGSVDDVGIRADGAGVALLVVGEVQAADLTGGGDVDGLVVAEQGVGADVVGRHDFLDEVAARGHVAERVGAIGGGVRGGDQGVG